MPMGQQPCVAAEVGQECGRACHWHHAALLHMSDWASNPSVGSRGLGQWLCMILPPAEREFIGPRPWHGRALTAMARPWQSHNPLLDVALPGSVRRTLLARPDNRSYFPYSCRIVAVWWPNRGTPLPANGAAASHCGRGRAGMWTRLSLAPPRVVAYVALGFQLAGGSQAHDHGTAGGLWPRRIHGTGTTHCRI